MSRKPEEYAWSITIQSQDWLSSSSNFALRWGVARKYASLGRDETRLNTAETCDGGTSTHVICGRSRKGFSIACSLLLDPTTVTSASFVKASDLMSPAE